MSRIEDRLERALVRLQVDLESLDVRWALVGGIAVTLRAEPRLTLDIDLAVAISEGQATDRLIRGLRDRGYKHRPHGGLFDTEEPLRELRFDSPEGVRIDLIVNWSGIEREIVESAEILPRGPLALPVCRTEYLLAIKLHANREKDRLDAREILRTLGSGEISRTRELLDLIARRTFGSSVDLQRRLTTLLFERQ